MLRSRYFILLLILPMWALACVLLAVTPIRPDATFEHFFIGLILGTLYGHTTVAAAWTALGPGPLILRLPLSIVWVLLLVLVVVVASPLRGEPGDIGAVLAISQATQWIASQIPYWAIAVFCGLRVQHIATEESGRRGQFGIGQLMIVTGIIGAVLGIVRLIVTNRVFSWGIDPDLPIFFFLVGTAVIMTLPLIIAAFLNRYWIWAVLGTVSFIIAITFAEMPLLDATVGRRGGPDLMHLVWINFFTTLWVLVLVLATRLSGYQFSGGKPLVGQLAE